MQNVFFTLTTFYICTQNRSCQTLTGVTFPLKDKPVFVCLVPVGTARHGWGCNGSASYSHKDAYKNAAKISWIFHNEHYDLNTWFTKTQLHYLYDSLFKSTIKLKQVIFGGKCALRKHSCKTYIFVQLIYSYSLKHHISCLYLSSGYVTED